MSAFVCFSGSRRLPASAGSLVSAVVGSVLRAGHSVSVGCASGADSAVVSACLSAGAAARLRVFAVFAPDGLGAWACSAVALVRRAFAAGAAVSWLSGGPASGDLVQRLRVRSARSVWWAARSGAGRGLVAFVVAPPPASPGTWGTVSFALRLGVPVVVFPWGFSAAALPSSLRGFSGSLSWVPAGRPGSVWARGFRAVVG